MTDISYADNWILIVGTFLPLVCVALMMFVPAAEEALHKQIAIVTSGATLAVGIWTLIKFDYDNSATQQFAVNEEWISVIKSRYGKTGRAWDYAAGTVRTADINDMTTCTLWRRFSAVNFFFFASCRRKVA